MEERTHGADEPRAPTASAWLGAVPEPLRPLTAGRANPVLDIGHDAVVAAFSTSAARWCPVLPDFLPPPTPVSLLYPRNRQLSPQVRVFIDRLVRTFEIGDGVQG